MISKKRISDLLEVHYKQPNGQVLSVIRQQIKNMGRISPIELGVGGKCGKDPEGISEWMFGKMMVRMENVNVLQMAS